MDQHLRTSVWISLAAAILTACGGGGGGASLTPGGSGVSATPTPTPVSVSSVVGSVNTLPTTCDGISANCVSTGPAAGFSVILGGVPAPGAGGFPVGSTYTATTDASGNFTLANVPTGIYEIAIGKDSTHATLHAKVTVPTSTTLKYGISALSSYPGSIPPPEATTQLVPGTSTGTQVTLAITYVNKAGETIPSVSLANPSKAQQVQVLSPSAAYDANGYNVYVSNPDGYWTQLTSTPVPLGTNFTLPGSPQETNHVAPPQTATAITAIGERTWFAEINSYRQSKGAPSIIPDEYAMEADRAYAEYVAADPTACGPTSCSGFSQFSQQYVSDGGIFAYGDSYRAALWESDCPSFTQGDSNQAPLLAKQSAVFGGYGFRLVPGATAGGAGVCVFAMVTN